MVECIEIIRDVYIIDIKVDPQNRIRQFHSDFHFDPEYIALKKSMKKFGQLQPVILDINYELIAGFLRFNVAIELGWSTIKAKIVDVSKEDKRLLEFLENWNRKDFTDYEVYRGLAMWKREYEEVHPETKQGKYIRSKDKNIKVHRDAFMPYNIKSFVEQHLGILGLKKRALFNKIRIGEAILDNKFDTYTINMIWQGKTSQNALLQILKRKEMREELLINTDCIPEEDTKLKKILNTITKSKFKSRKLEKCTSSDLPNKSELKPFEVNKERRKDTKPNNEEILNLNLKRKNDIENITENKRQEEQSCIDCRKARVSACPHCLAQFVICLNDIEKGCFVLKKANSKKCKGFEI